MNKITFNELKEFAKQHSTEDIRVTLTDVEKPFAAMSYFNENPKRIEFDKTWWNKGGKGYPPFKQRPQRAKNLMLHELGHLAKKHSMTKVRKLGWTKIELEAQLWAMKKARETKDKELIKDSIQYMNRWGNLKIMRWNTPERRYILAHRKYKEMKKYG